MYINIVSKRMRLSIVYLIPIDILQHGVRNARWQLGQVASKLIRVVPSQPRASVVPALSEFILLPGSATDTDPYDLFLYHTTLTVPREYFPWLLQFRSIFAPQRAITLPAMILGGVWSQFRPNKEVGRMLKLPQEEAHSSTSSVYPTRMR